MHCVCFFTHLLFPTLSTNQSITMATFTNQAANLSALGSRISRLLDVSENTTSNVGDGECANVS